MSDKPRLSEMRSFREVLTLAQMLDCFEKSRPHPGVDDGKAKAVRAQLVADLNVAMGEALAEHAELSAPPAPTPEEPAADASTDPPPPPAT